MREAPTLDVAVVIPVRDGARHLREAVESVLAQEVSPREVVVVDDGSVDGSAAVARAVGGFVRVISQDALGAGAARNRGVAETSAPWIAFLDADDRWLSGKLLVQRDALASIPGAVASIGRVRQFFDPELGRFGVPAPEILDGPTVTTLLVRRDAFLATGGFSTDLSVAEAAEWWLRFEAGAPTVVRVASVVAERRIHARNTGLLRPALRQDYVRLARARLARGRGGGASG